MGLIGRRHRVFFSVDEMRCAFTGADLTSIPSAFAETLHYATKRPAGVNRKPLETVIWAMATATQSPLLGGAS